MNLTLFGTCRLNNIRNHNNLHNELNYTHSTKEVIQLIKFLQGELTFTNPYNILCFRTGICKNKPIYNSDNYKERFSKSDLCVIEICSYYKYIHNNYYLHHLPFDKYWQKLKKYTNKIPKIIFLVYSREISKCSILPSQTKCNYNMNTAKYFL